MALAPCERPQPSRRNFSLTANPSRADELLLFGGESFNGKNVRCFNELYVVRSGQRWFQANTPNAPPPRDSHQAG